jgi:hypothetical protein
MAEPGECRRHDLEPRGPSGPGSNIHT